MKNNVIKHSIITITAALSLAGCVSTGQLGNAPIVLDDNFATVHIARPEGFTGCGGNMKIQINDADFYGLACGVHISFRVPANERVTISQVTSIKPDHIKVVPEKGEIVYMVCDCIPFAGCGLNEVEKSYFRNVVQRCGEEHNIRFSRDSSGTKEAK